MPELLFEQPLTQLGLPDDGFRRRADAVFGHTVFEHHSRTRNLRDLHAALTHCALLTLSDSIKPVLILEKPHISHERIESEIFRFLDIIRPETAKRLNIVITRKQSEIDYLIGDLTKEEEGQIPDIIRHDITRRLRLRRRGFSSFDILRVLSIHWLRGTGPITLKRLGLECGLSYPSVARVLDEFEGIIDQRSDRSVQLSAFPESKWAEAVINSPKARSSQGYYVPDGKPRAFDSLISRLSENQVIDFALGGIHAARHYYPGIDLVGTPRLDITLHLAQPMEVRHLLRHLDPALRPVESGSLPQVVIHQLDRPEPFFVNSSNEFSFSDEVDCLLDLHEARLEPQAAELLLHLTTQRSL
jgi:hypothetical protein